MLHVTRVLAELDAVTRTGRENGSGSAGDIRLGVALPPIGAPLSKLLADGRAKHPNVVLTVSEMSGRDMAAALEERRLDAALIKTVMSCSRPNFWRSCAVIGARNSQRNGCSQAISPISLSAVLLVNRRPTLGLTQSR